MKLERQLCTAELRIEEMWPKTSKFWNARRDRLEDEILKIQSGDTVEEEGLKECRKCHQGLPLEQFYLNRNTGVYHSRCKVCHLARDKQNTMERRRRVRESECKG